MNKYVFAMMQLKHFISFSINDTSLIYFS